ncbi:hypothetical protein E2P81_ATG00637 [Venturia nashicola]|uniref:Synaptobrevin n=1 Tax=Venturia nashicola TaxID=86259 RepID=A0A4Z1PG16_9PEZI|nr:hypothetical protein E6O75_ATG00650 [Venturia nashicola]TLD39650.1 hypothetical protein E2P81_ATG00637 [Venturia nashicola]
MARIDAIESRPDPTQINLSRILTRLERTVLSPESNQDLKSSYERAKVGANIEYARSLLLRLEHDTPNIKTATRKQATQSDLQAKRDLIKRLQARLQELNSLAADSESSSDEDEEETPSYAPASKASNSLDTQPTDAQEAASHISSTLRSRNAQSAAPNIEPTATTTSSRYGNKPNAPQNVADREARLMADRAEQEDITANLAKLAQALKASAVNFHTTIEADKDTVKRAVLGLDKNVTGMADAGNRMGELTRNQRGEGLLAQIPLLGPLLGGMMGKYVQVGLLWLVALLLFVFLPKLRF